MIPSLPPMTPRERRALLRLIAASTLEGVGMSGVVILGNVMMHTEHAIVRVICGFISVFLVIGIANLYANILPRLGGELIDEVSARRLLVTDRLRTTPLRVHEQRPDLANTLARTFDQLDDIPLILGLLGFMCTSVLLSTVFIASLSGAGFVLWLGIAAAIVLFHRRTRAEHSRFAPALAQARVRFANALRIRLEGHAQLQHDARARTENLNDLVVLERDTATQQDHLNHSQGASLAWGEDVLLVGLAVVLFRLPDLAGISLSTQYQVTSIILSISGVTLVVVGLLNQAQAIREAYMHLLEIEAQLGPPAGAPPSRPTLPAGPDLTLELDQVSFAYEGGGFRVGPVSLRARGGELVIVRGGNGSGKTTLMRVLSGLYPAQGGRIRLGGQRVTAEDLVWYQSHVTAIFTGQYLFDAPYGLDASEEEVNALLQRFGLGDTMTLREGRFSRTTLSSGQSKRLAMVVALLERRPVLVFDEWDSHQDPGLRAFYYETLLPELKAQGKIIFAVSHDARRFHLADQLLHLGGGRQLEAQDISEDNEEPA